VSPVFPPPRWGARRHQALCGRWTFFLPAGARRFHSVRPSCAFDVAGWRDHLLQARSAPGHDGVGGLRQATVRACDWCLFQHLGAEGPAAIVNCGTERMNRSSPVRRPKALRSAPIARRLQSSRLEKGYSSHALEQYVTPSSAEPLWRPSRWQTAASNAVRLGEAGRGSRSDGAERAVGPREGPHSRSRR